MLAKPLLFLSSYAPLFALLGIRFSDYRLQVGCAALAVIGVASLWLILLLNRRVEPSPHELTRVRAAGPEAASYLASYLLPFLTISNPSLLDAIAYVLFMCVAYAVYVQSSLIQINPLLYIFRYKVFQVSDSHGLTAHLITRRSVSEGDVINATRFRDDILIRR